MTTLYSRNGSTAALNPAPEHTPSKAGAKVGNVNAQRHGLRSAELPKGCRYIERTADRLRLDLESEVCGRHGSIGTYRAALIQSACRHEKRASLCERWLRLADGNGEKLSTLDRASLLREVSNATDSRDKCIERLGLDRPERESILDALYRTPAPDVAPQREAIPETAEISSSEQTASETLFEAQGANP